MMILGIVGNDDDSPPGSAAALAQLPKELPGGHRVKAMVFSRKEKLPIPQTDRAEIADTLARGLVKHHWVVHFRRDPHTGPGTVLLEVHFINRPQIHGGISCQCAEFFYAWLVLAGQPEQSKVAVCGGESLTGETASGTDAP